MNLAFLLHIYQPPIQDEKILSQIVDDCYKPLIKLIKNSQNLQLTLNIPLSLVYLLNSTGNDNLIKSIKELYESGKVELTSSGAYHPLLTKIPWEIAEKEIILNEYGLGYYFGKDKGFEGEDAILAKNLTGFFPPEMAINQELVKNLDEMGYQWVVVDEPAIIGSEKDNISNTVFGYPDLNIKIVKRNTEISNIISFKRDFNIDDLIEKILYLRQDGKDAVIALDGEAFGHHNKEGIYLFENLVSTCNKLQINLVTVSQLVENSDVEMISGINESTWGMSSEDYIQKNIYPLWQDKDNPIQTIMWEVFNKFTDAIKKAFSQSDPVYPPSSRNIIFEIFPIWDINSLEKVDDVSIKNNLFRNVLFLQSLNSDQFWWGSKKEVGGNIIFDKNYIMASLEVYKKLALIMQDDLLYEFVDNKTKEITALIG